MTFATTGKQSITVSDTANSITATLDVNVVSPPTTGNPPGPGGQGPGGQGPGGQTGGGGTQTGGGQGGAGSGGSTQVDLARAAPAVVKALPPRVPSYRVNRPSRVARR